MTSGRVTLSGINESIDEIIKSVFEGQEFSVNVSLDSGGTG